MHLHLRQGDILSLCAPESARWFARAVIMPNTTPPINNSDRVISYRKEIVAAASGKGAFGKNVPGNDDFDNNAFGKDALKGEKENFTPLMSFKIYPHMKEEEVIKLAEAGVVAGKLYPEGSTTNSEDGIKTWKQAEEAISAMSKLGIVLSIHGEKPDSFVLDREKDYLPELFDIIEHFPNLRVVLEHVSCAEAVDAVLKGPATLGATITAHHLLLTLDDLLGTGINPHLFCKPIVKSRKDREAIQNAALSANSKFFFGSDSAPHPEASKLRSNGSAGIFSAPAAFPLLVSFFEKNGSIELLENFTSRYGAEFYKLPLNNSFITIEKRKNILPDKYLIPSSVEQLLSNKGSITCAGLRPSLDIIPFMAGSVLEWCISAS